MFRSPLASARTHVLFAVLFLHGAIVPAASSSAPARIVPSGTFEQVRIGLPMRLAESMTPDAEVRLLPAEVGAVDQLAAMRDRNASGRLPIQVGFHRPLASPIEARLDPSLWLETAGRKADRGWVAISPRGNLVWGTAIEVDGAERLRVRLTRVHLPEGARIWAYGLGQEGRSFGVAASDEEAVVWSPTVEGDRIQIEVELPRSSRGGHWGFHLDQVAEIFEGAQSSVRASPEASPEDCLEFASCFDATDFPAYETAKGAIVNILFEDEGITFTCSGGLLNYDTEGGPVTNLYLLTANHCIRNQASADTIDPAYNFRWNACPPSSWNYDLGPIGGTLLATAPFPGPDVSLVAMNTAGIDFPLSLLGWTTSAVAPGTKLFRLSHPYSAIPGSGDPDKIILPQMYSEQSSTSSPDFLCEGVELDTFLHSVMSLGTTAGGSSGAPLMLPTGQVVGQLLGKCPSSFDSCQYDTFDSLDGRFDRSYPLLATYLSPSSSGPCVPGPTTACLGVGGRFKVEGWMKDFATPPTQYPLQVAQLGGGDVLSQDSAVMFAFAADNWELLIKVLNGCVLNNSYWVYYAATTNVEYQITVTDTQTGLPRVYSNTAGVVSPAVTDTNAFATCP